MLRFLGAATVRIVPGPWVPEPWKSDIYALETTLLLHQAESCDVRRPVVLITFSAASMSISAPNKTIIPRLALESRISRYENATGTLETLRSYESLRNSDSGYFAGVVFNFSTAFLLSHYPSASTRDLTSHRRRQSSKCCNWGIVPGAYRTKAYAHGWNKNEQRYTPNAQR
jgi:hypothetical protein